jgi:hypothetical protein
MNAWRNFVDSISSRGGTILILLVITMVLGIMVIRHGQDQGEAASLIRSTFSAFSGALLTAVTLNNRADGKSLDPTQAPGSGATQPTGDHR